MIGQELHKIRQRDRKIPISKSSRTAWQNQTDSKNRTDFGFSCKQGVTTKTTIQQQQKNMEKIAAFESKNSKP
jgi:hypothetical protein